MNKKTISIFVTGIILGAVAFALASLSFYRSITPGVPAVSEKMPQAVSTPVPSTVSVPLSRSTDTLLFNSLLSKGPDAYSISCEVKKGDSLTNIAKKNGTTIDLIRKVNGLPSTKLSVGQKLKVPNVKFALVIDKSQNTLILKVGEEILKTYIVSTGANNSTPVGVFKVTDKLINPTWYKSGAVVPHGSPANVLGTRWIGLTQKGYGIHGTTEPDKLGQQVTAGCVRMRNEEVEELFGFVVPGTEVTIVD